MDRFIDGQTDMNNKTIGQKNKKYRHTLQMYNVKDLRL